MRTCQIVPRLCLGAGCRPMHIPVERTQIKPSIAANCPAGLYDGRADPSPVRLLRPSSPSQVQTTILRASYPCICIYIDNLLRERLYLDAIASICEVMAMRSRRGSHPLGDPMGGMPSELVTPSHGAQFDVVTADTIDGRAPTRSKSRRRSVRARSDARSYASGERP